MRTPSFSMDCFRFGRGEKTLVILPGLSVQSVLGSADAIARAYRLLTDDFTILVLDRRTDVPASYPVRDMARDTALALRALGVDRASFFGASQGGMIAMTLAITHPDLVEKLALGSTSARVTDAQYAPIGEWIRLARAKDAQALYLAFGEAVYPRAVFENARALLIEAAKTVTQAELDRFVILAEGTKGFDVSDELDRIACPVLVIGDADDRVLGPDASRQIRERLAGRPDCALYMYDGCGHAAYDTAPDYTERLLRFLSPGSGDQP